MTTTTIPGDMDNTVPLVSIALCTYNGANFLREQLDSLFAQTHCDFEIIAVDDCSTDNTVDILNEYAVRDARLRVYVNHVNAGIRNNFANALHRCRGAFIAPCDQDDIWLPEKMSTLLQTIGTHALVYCDSELIAETGQSLGSCISDLVTTLSTNDPAMFLFANCVSGHAMLLRRDVLDQALPVPEEFFYDWWLAVVAATKGGVIYCPRPLVRYRQHANNVTNIRRDRISPRARKPPGYKLQALRETERRISLLAALPGPQQPMLVKLKRLWHAREMQWLSPSLVFFMTLHGARLYATLKRVSRWLVLRRACYYFWGVRAKRLVSQYAYQDVALLSSGEQSVQLTQTAEK